MSHYEKLGTLGVRWIAVGFVVLAGVSLLFAGGMMSMTGAAGGGASGHMGEMMQIGGWMWLGPTLLNLLVGFVLYGVSKPLGRLMASGLE